ncbi:MAG: hypothetical protein WCA13_00010 [Terriglobales bacterium]
MLCRLEEAGCVALVTVQLQKHLGQKKAENAESRRQRNQERYGHFWLFEVRDQYRNEERDGKHHQGDRSYRPSALWPPFRKRFTAESVNLIHGFTKDALFETDTQLSGVLQSDRICAGTVCSDTFFEPMLPQEFTTAGCLG